MTVLNSKGFVKRLIWVGLQDRSSGEVVTKCDRKVRIVRIVRSKRVSGSPAKIEVEVEREATLGCFEMIKEGKRVVSMRTNER